MSAAQSDYVGVLETVDALLSDYHRAEFKDFIRSDGKGALRYIGEDPYDLSAVNTAALCQFFDGQSEYSGEEERRTAESWKQGIVADTIQAAIDTLPHGVDDESEGTAYRLAQMLRCSRDIRGAAVLSAWLETYIQEFFSGLKGDSYPSPFLAFLATLALRENELNPPANVTRLAEDVLLRNLAAASASADQHCDALDVAYSLCLLPGDSRVSADLRRLAIEVLDRKLNIDGVWRNQQRWESFGRHQAGGSAFLTCLEILRAPIEHASRGRLWQLVMRHVQWLRSSASGMTPWRASDVFMRRGRAETWFNCLIVEFLLEVRKKLAGHEQELILRKYDATRKPAPVIGWKNLLLETDVHHSLTVMRDEAKKRTGKLVYKTAILFGPPGTAKSSIAREMAADLGWPFIELGVGDFLVDGVDGVFSRSLVIMRDLVRLEHVVVLLDEVESLFAERDRERLIQQFLTGALLPPLQKLSQKAASLVFIATNDVTAFDQAVRRAGRIDLILPIGPPNSELKARFLVANGLPKTKAAKLAKMLPVEMTVSELNRLCQLPDFQSASADRLFREYRDVLGEKTELDAEALADHSARARTYQRLVK